MNIGKQSTLNDLSDLKTDLEAQIEEAKAIKVGEVSQIESGNVRTSDVDIFKQRPNGVYYVDQTNGDVSESPFLRGLPLDKNGMMLSMTLPFKTNYSSSILMQWDGSLIALIVQNGNHNVVNILTSKNTITDSNGFIKAA